MSTPAPSTSPAAAPADLPRSDPFAPSKAALRVFALLGFPLLAVAWVLFAIIVLHQAYSGDGASGPLAGAAQAALTLSPAAGLVSFCLPDTPGHRARRITIWIQYGLLVAGPVLAAVDFS
ncbi:hypothetical protein CP973_29360 [Streptomyces albofaciens JCM 4342]|uniref:hypothetical protein n=1 Tax=Streptomyces albofaciens TaxID=66866 RepID=UPI00123B7861|nr:hypothetical protein [Streptomyces albofaciens]KAA6213359.1 hypothetical protein CP973_29360 [Streptomyces albofaciens JCM 4342]